MRLVLLEDILISEGIDVTFVDAGIIIREAVNTDLATDLYQILGQYLRKFGNDNASNSAKKYTTDLLKQFIWPKLHNDSIQGYQELSKTLMGKYKQYDGTNDQVGQIKKMAYSALVEMLPSYRQRVEQHFDQSAKPQPQQQQAEPEQQEDHACIAYTNKGQQPAIKGSGKAYGVLSDEISKRVPPPEAILSAIIVATIKGFIGLLNHYRSLKEALVELPSILDVHQLTLNLKHCLMNSVLLRT